VSSLLIMPAMWPEKGIEAGYNPGIDIIRKGVEERQDHDGKEKETILQKTVPFGGFFYRGHLCLVFSHLVG